MPKSDDRSLSAARLIDADCGRFESQWKGGHQPRIEQFVDATPALTRTALLRALLLLELELRRQSGESPSLDEYKRRFPGDQGVVTEVFSHFATGATAPLALSDSPTAKLPQHPAAAGRGAPPPAFSTFGRFELLEVLGEGGFGMVFRARDPQLDREVAIKIPKEGVLSRPEDRERFIREGQAAATVQHPNLCPVYEAGEVDGRPYIVMALIEGQPLSKVLERSGRILERSAAATIRKLAAALHAAHQKGIIHRDLKPSNVIIDRKGQPVIMDFGLSRRLDPNVAALTQSGAILGTPAYMAPEQALAQAAQIGPATDIYALGMILYEMLAGERPFTGDLATVLAQVASVEPKPPSALRPDVDPRLEAICLKAISKNIADRYRSMRELAAALGEYLKATDPAAKTVQTAVETREIAALVTGMQSQLTTLAKKHRGTWWKWMAGSAVTAALVVAALFFFWGSREPRTQVKLKFVEPYLADTSLSYFLDSKPITADALATPVTLAVGDHLLEIRRQVFVIKQFMFAIGPDQAEVVTADAEYPPGSVSEGDPAKQVSRFLDEFPRAPLPSIVLITAGDSTDTLTMCRMVSAEQGPQPIRGASLTRPFTISTMVSEAPVAFDDKNPAKEVAYLAWSPVFSSPAWKPVFSSVPRKSAEFLDIKGHPLSPEAVQRALVPRKLVPVLEVFPGATEVDPVYLQILKDDTVLVRWPEVVPPPPPPPNGEPKPPPKDQPKPKPPTVDNIPASPAPSSVSLMLASSAKDTFWQCMVGSYYHTKNIEVVVTEGERKVHQMRSVFYMTSHLNFFESRFENMQFVDTKGKALPLEAVQKALRDKPIPVLVANGHEVDPLYLQIFKNETMIQVQPQGPSVSPEPPAPAPPPSPQPREKAQVRPAGVPPAAGTPPPPPPVAAPPELTLLKELPQDAYNSAPWVSPDGLTLYWQSTAKGEKQRWVWRAERKSADALFESARKLVPGSDPTVTGDELEMILLNLDGRNLYSTARKTKKDDFGRPRKIPELDGVGFLASPCLSEDGLVLWADRIQDGKAAIVRLQRPSRDGAWGKPEAVKMPLIGSTGRFVYVVPKKRYGFCCVPDLLKDKSANNLVYLSTMDQGATFTNPVLVELPMEVVRGKSPRYVEATRELFFSGDLEEGGSAKLFVIRNLNLSAFAKK